jgi:hypothetical protein
MIVAGPRQVVQVARPAHPNDFIQIVIFCLPAWPPLAKIFSSKE